MTNPETRSRTSTRGLSREEFADKRSLIRRPQADQAQLYSQLVHPPVACVILGISSFWLVYLPIAWEFILVLQCLYWLMVWWRVSSTSDAPNLLPRTAKVKRDPNNPLPGSGLFGPPMGDMYLGVERATNKQVWMQFKDWLRHGLVTGTTGSGKTELLIAIAYNFLSAGGAGLMFADPKGDTKAALKLGWIASRFGREDDLLVCNYIRPANADIATLDYQATNTINPAQTGNAQEVSNMLVSLMPKNTDGNNAVFEVQLIL